MPNTSLGYTATPANANLDALPQLPGLLGALPANVVAALAQFNVIPVVASAAARDALIPAPVANMRVERSDTGYRERYDGAKWLPEGVLRSVGPVVSVLAKRADPTGATDSRAALLDADNAVAAIGRAELDPGTYLVNADLTLANPWSVPWKGAKIKPAAGVTVTITGPVEAGSFQWMDFSAGGGFSFVGNKGIHRYNPVWWGVVGDAVTDDVPALNAMTQSIPNSALVALPHGLQMRVNSTWYTQARTGIRYVSEHLPFPDNSAPATALLWGGAVGGTIARFDLCNRCNLEGFGIEVDYVDQTKTAYIAVESDSSTFFAGIFAWINTRNYRPGEMVSNGGVNYRCIKTNLNQAPPNATYWVPLAWSNATAYAVGDVVASGTDLFFCRRANTNQALPASGTTNFYWGALVGPIGSHCQFRYLNIHQKGAPEANLIGISINTSRQTNNQEYHRIEFCQFFAGGAGGGVTQENGPSPATTFTVTAGLSTIIANAANFHNGQSQGFVAGHVGQQIRLANGGAGGTVLYSGKVLAISGDGLTATMDTAAAHNSTVARILVGTTLGTAIFIGPSANPKKIRIRENDIINWNFGVYAQGGSFQCYENSFSVCEVNYRIGDPGSGGPSEPCGTYGDNTEASRKHVQMYGPQPLTMMNARFGNIWMIPNGGYFEIGFSAHNVLLLNYQFDDPLNTGNLAEGTAKAFDLINFSGNFIRQGGQYNLTPIANLGDTPNGGGHIESIGEGIFSDAPAANFSYNGGVYRQGIPNSIPAVWGDGQDAGGSDSPVGVRGTVTCPTGSAAGGTANGVEGQLIVPFGLAREGAAVRAKGINWTTGAAAVAAIAGFIADSPIITNGRIDDHYGLRVKQQKSSSRITRGHGVYQDDPGDDNSFAGPTAIGGLTTFGSGKVEKATVYIDIGAGGNATPNPAGAESYRYRIAGAATINAPINPADGMTFKMEIFNNTGGAITPALNAIFLGTGYGAIGAGKSRTRLWQYDSALVKWKPVGAVSEDF